MLSDGTASRSRWSKFYGCPACRRWRGVGTDAAQLYGARCVDIYFIGSRGRRWRHCPGRRALTAISAYVGGRNVRLGTERRAFRQELFAASTSTRVVTCAGRMQFGHRHLTNILRPRHSFICTHARSMPSILSSLHSPILSIDCICKLLLLVYFAARWVLDVLF